MKKSIEKKSYYFPHPVLIVGTYDKDMNPNIMAVSWGGMVCSEPACISISVRKARHTYSNLMDTGAFTVNLPSEHQIIEADLTGVASGKTMNKFEEASLTPVRSELVNAPYIKEFPVNLMCKTIQVLELGVHYVFIGEILDVLVDEECLDEKGNPDINKVKPFSFNSADRCYYATGDKLMQAYTIKNIKKL